MDALLSSLGMYAVNCATRMAIKSGVSLTASYTAKQASRLLSSVDDTEDRAELKRLHKLLRNKIQIVTPAIDLIEFKAGRGNVFLDEAVSMARSLHRDIERLGKRLETAAAVEEAIAKQPECRTTRVIEQQHDEIKAIIADMKAVMAQIDQNVHYLQLAISGSGETMPGSLFSSISPSRLLQASAYLNVGDLQFASDPTKPVQIGSAMSLSLYMLFLGHSDSTEPNGVCRHNKSPPTPKTPRTNGSPTAKVHEAYGVGEGERKPIWQEVIHKARIRIVRTPTPWLFDREFGYRPPNSPSTSHSTPPPDPRTSTPTEYSYHIEIVEDLDDGRLHDDEGSMRPQPFDDILAAGIRESLPVFQISKIFYTDKGQLLNIGNETENNAVLLLKRDIAAVSPLHRNQQWNAGPQAGDSLVEEDAAAEGDDSDEYEDDEWDVDRQLFEESEIVDCPGGKDGTQDMRNWRLPQHLDQEWLAFEVYDDEKHCGSDTEDEDEDVEDVLDDRSDTNGNTITYLTMMEPKEHKSTTSVDNRLLEQFRNISITFPPTTSTPSPQVAKDLQHQEAGNSTSTSLDHDANPESFVARSPFGQVAPRLSLLEMLLRLASLQESQQSSHLAIPDSTLTFFLEQASTTGLRGEQRWRVRSDTKRRVGFDPYLDQTPEKGAGQ